MAHNKYSGNVTFYVMTFHLPKSMQLNMKDKQVVLVKIRNDVVKVIVRFHFPHQLK